MNARAEGSGSDVDGKGGGVCWVRANVSGDESEGSTAEEDVAEEEDEEEEDEEEEEDVVLVLLSTFLPRGRTRDLLSILFR